MQTLIPTHRASQEPDSIEAAVRALDLAWADGEVGIEEIKAAYHDNDSLSLLTALIKTDLRCRFDRGLRPAAADYLDEFPGLREDKDRVVSLIYEEFCLLEEHGVNPDPSAFCERYASWRSSLASQLEYHRVLSQFVAPVSTPRFPEPGERFDRFQLDKLLGRGGAARVYLARDESLGDRKVALKVSSDRGNEPSIMGRLAHEHIVPVLSVAFDTKTGLRGLCMPYRQGLSLDKVIQIVQPSTIPQQARALSDAMATVSDETGVQAATDVEWEGFPIRGNYAEGVAWIGATLARALAHAHERGILHRDVKPANVLLTVREGPQLLDFNLAHDPHTAVRAEAALRGGTLPYMAPEQLRAFLDPDEWEHVGVAADTYSLGLLLRALLIGEEPETPEFKLPLPRAIRSLLDRRAAQPLTIRTINPAVPHALEAILSRCLAFEPDLRYPSALDLAEELESFLTRQPLRLAINPSRRERFQNYVHRNRRAATLIAGLVLLIVGLIIRFAPIEYQGDFKAAVKQVRASQFERAVVPLRSLSTRFPDSPLPRILLGIALDRAGDPLEADEQLRAGLTGPSAGATIAQFLRSNPGLRPRVVEAADHLRARRKFDAARLAYELVLRGEPGSRDARYGLALCFEIQRAYESALGYLSPVIKEIENEGTDEERRLLLRCYAVRARILTRLGDSFANQDPARSDRCFAEAESDLDRTEARLTAADRDGRFTVQFLRAELQLGRVDVELARGAKDSAARWWENSQEILARLKRENPERMEIKLLSDRSRVLADKVSGTSPGHTNSPSD